MVLDLSPRFDPEGDTFRYTGDNLTDVQLEAAGGSGDCQDDTSLGWYKVNSRRCSVAVGFHQMRHWTRRFTL